LNIIRQLIKLNKVLFVGVGNPLKKDDGVGVYICQKLRKNPDLNVLIVESGLEKYIGKINMINPEILILVDCTHFPNQAPGHYDLLKVNDISRFILNTHHISLNNISDFLNMPVYILGIHPHDISVGEKLSSPVKKAADQVVSYIYRSLYL
jgi:hydrogenase 3 maturation protease